MNMKTADANPMYSKNMRAYRLYICERMNADDKIPADNNQTNYLLNTLRLKEGDTILVFNGKDGEWRARILQPSRKKMLLEIQEQIRPQPAFGTEVKSPQNITRNNARIHYLFAPLKRARQDYLVQKATEMGVASLQPVMTRRTIVKRINPKRMQANIIEAAQQCGTLFLPELKPATELEKLFKNWPEETGLIFCDEREAGKDSAPLSILQTMQGKYQNLFLLIGPEGGFDPAERSFLRQNPDTHILPLGPRILRADTAAVAALGLVNAVLGDW